MISLYTLACALAQELDSSLFSVSIVKEPSGDFFHYYSDGKDDVGWGCGYRSLQSLCSWAVKHSPLTTAQTVPTLLQIQETLVEVGDKPSSFIDSKEWIGCFEASIVIDQIHKIPCKLLHLRSGSDIVDVCEELQSHFDSIGSPVMIGGDRDAASKTLVGVAVWNNKESNRVWKFLIADPHYIGCDSSSTITENQGIKWHDTDIFEHSSFYNFCIPIK